MTRRFLSTADAGYALRELRVKARENRQDAVRAKTRESCAESLVPPAAQMGATGTRGRLMALLGARGLGEREVGPGLPNQALGLSKRSL